MEWKDKKGRVSRGGEAMVMQVKKSEGNLRVSYWNEDGKVSTED